MLYKTVSIRFTLSLICCYIVLLLSPTITPLFGESNSDEEQPLYVITDIKFFIQGMLTEAALKSKLAISTDKQFYSLDELHLFIKDKRTILKNQRALSDMSTLLYTHMWNEELQQYDVTISIYATANWAILALPYFKYSSNSGLLLGIRGRDYNFLGSLERLYINLDHSISGLGEITDPTMHETQIGFGFQYPFFPFKKNTDHILTFVTNEGLSYNFGQEDLENNVDVGFLYSYTLTPRITLLSSLTQLFATNVDPTFVYTYGENQSSFSMDFILNRIPLISTSTPAFSINNITYTPSLTYKITYPVEGNDNNEHRLNNNIILGNKLSFGQHSWVPGQFFRQGFLVTLANNYTYTHNITNTLDRGYTIDMSIEGTGHFLVSNFMGINIRGYAVHNIFLFPDETDTGLKGTDLGERLRGIIDNEIVDSHTAFVLNADAMFKLFQIRPIAEFHLGPTFDIAIHRRDYETTQFDFNKDFKVAMGIEGIAHMLFSNTIRVRGSYGIDVMELIETGKYSFDNREIFIGLSLFY